MTDLTKLTAPLGLLDEVYGPGTEEALKAHGGPYEIVSISGLWMRNENPSWYRSSTYRVAPATQDTVPWHIAPEAAKWYARDENERCYFYETAPVNGGIFWMQRDKTSWRIDGFPGHAIGTVDWKDSLQERPEQ